MANDKMPERLTSAEKLPANDAARRAEGDWSTLASRAIDDISRIIQSEIGLLETTLRAVVEEQTDYALANLAVVAVMVCAASCMLGALILFLHQWLLWWLAFAITGVVASAAGIVVHAVFGRRVAVRPARIKDPQER
jgi:Putative Actinobacterial Holin-X, holin superfamily III